MEAETRHNYNASLTQRTPSALICARTGAGFGKPHTATASSGGGHVSQATYDSKQALAQAELDSLRGDTAGAAAK